MMIIAFIYIYIRILCIYTSSTAQSGGGSFNDRQLYER